MQEPAYREDIRGQLRTAGYKVTPMRLMILDALRASRHPLSVRRILRTLGGRTDVDTVTVYRTLRTLVDAGLIRQIDLRHGHAHFELVDTKQDYHHIVCVTCDRVANIRNCCSVKRVLPRALRQSGFARVTDHTMEFFGVCRQCAQKNA